MKVYITVLCDFLVLCYQCYIETLLYRFSCSFQSRYNQKLIAYELASKDNKPAINHYIRSRVSPIGLPPVKPSFGRLVAALRSAKLITLSVQQINKEETK